jgi:outer membrane receptor protein involved in Fe transport
MEDHAGEATIRPQGPMAFPAVDQKQGDLAVTRIPRSDPMSKTQPSPHGRIQSISEWLFVLTALFLVAAVICPAQTTGKISGRLTDSATGEPLIGANIVIEGTSLGAVSDLNGEYFVINIPPKTYRVRASIIGYVPMVLQGLVVSMNRTSTADFKLKEGLVQGKEVVVTAKRIETKKDQTSSIRNVTSEQIELLPVESLDAIVSLQAGVVRGHFRGGRDSEVSYMINGVRVNDSYGLNRAVTVEKEVISEVEVITGTFNAEYGNAMSGVVNAVTKDGSDRFHGSLSLNGSNYLTPHGGVFPHLSGSEPFRSASDAIRSKDYKFFLEGPVPRLGRYLTFVFNGRYQDNQGARNGIRRFMPDDYSDFTSIDSSAWYSEHTGNGAVVPMETNTSLTMYGKLSFKPSGMLRSSLSYSYNDNESRSYSHYYKYNPDGRGTSYGQSHLVTATLNHTLSHSFFYEAKASYMESRGAFYRFENPGDPRYVHDLCDAGGSVPGFSTGGMDRGWGKNWSKDFNFKLDAMWQLNKRHTFKSGADATRHEINRFNTSIRNKYHNTPEENTFYLDPVSGKRVFPYYEAEPILERSTATDIYDVRPWEYSAYVQDKMEFQNMVVNLGLRYDYFDPNTTYPSEPRNPGNDLTSNPLSAFLRAPAASHISPRFGISYQLGTMALLRFSYGHFFQMPPLYALYTNNAHVVGTADLQTIMGNPLVKPQKTIQYEAGLWQQLNANMSLEVAVFYRDIYDLLGTQIITTFNQIRYGLYSNKDYGNARGLELKYDTFFGPFSGGVNYTLQYTRGNANNPTYTFSRAGSRLDPVNILIPMDWDQRHTLNVSLSYSAKRYGASATGRFDSGEPYNWTPLTESPLRRVNLPPNNSSRPSLFSVDLEAYANLWTLGSTRMRLTLLVYNLFDRLNENSVDATTGRANQVIYRQEQLDSYRSDFSTIYDRDGNPSAFSSPRLVKMGIEFIF